ncbi:glucooligosaccharide oxidase [Seiridium cupressi]
MTRLAIPCLGLFAALANAFAIHKRAAIDDCLSAASVPVDTPGSDDWKADGAPYNPRLTYTPIAIAVPTKLEHIQSAVSCAAKVGLKINAKSGGHSYTSLGFGGEDGHLMVQMDRMYNVTLDKTTNVATIQAGARLGHAATELYNQGQRAFSHGTCPGVGVSGHSLHGGFGMSSHLHGLATDWIAGITIVLANSTVVHASETENQDLFWAMRGGGSNFGIAASFEFNTFAAPANVTWFTASLPFTKANGVAGLEALEEYVKNTMPAELNLRIFASSYFTQLEGLFYGDDTGLHTALTPLLNKTGGSIQQSQSVGWLDALSHYANGKLDVTHPYSLQETIYSKSLELTGLNGTAAQNFVNYWFDVAKGVTSRSWYFQLDMHGGKNSAVTNGNHDLSSYAHRDKLYLIQFYDRQYIGAYPADGPPFLDGWVGNTTAALANADWGMYINYADSSLSRTMAQDAYYGVNLPRLQRIKAAVDPTELFYNPQSIQPNTTA